MQISGSALELAKAGDIGGTDLLSAVTETRASAAKYFNGSEYVDSSGTALRRGAYTNPKEGVAAIGPGLLLEPASTNHIVRSSGMSGAVVGRLDASGSLPTGWVWAEQADDDQTEVIGTGTEYGLDYIDVRFNFTQTSGGTIAPKFEFGGTSEYAAAAQDDYWTFSIYYRAISGDFTGIDNFSLRIREFNSSNGVLETHTDNQTAAVSSTFARYENRQQLTNASTAKVAGFLALAFGNGDSCDCTLRIYQPQLENHPYATSPIETTGTTATRAADPAIAVTDTNIAASAMTMAVSYVPLHPGNSAGTSRKLVRTSGGGSAILQVFMFRSGAGDYPLCQHTETGGTEECTSLPNQTDTGVNRLMVAGHSSGTDWALNGTTQSLTARAYANDDTSWRFVDDSGGALILSAYSFDRALPTAELASLTGT